MPATPAQTTSGDRPSSPNRDERNSAFQFVREWDSEFLALFPHRFDYIVAEHPEPGQSPPWQTESRHPLSDRLLQQGAYLFGVRFGSHSRYSVIDLDIASPYHPLQDPLAIARIRAALEPLGLVTCVICTSSSSGGLHLYFPFEEAQCSWEIALAFTTLLSHAGFKLLPGVLEVFPNSKPYTVAGKPSLFNGHRLPMQAGSYLLNDAFQPIWSDSQTFVKQWQFAQQRNTLNTTVLKQVIQQVNRRQYRVSGKADKFINDLNAEIEPGWTGPGQTNRLLGRITMRCYIFHHILYGGKPLEGQALIDEIVATARSLPGYGEWCRHQHEIESRAAEWARCIENSCYFHYGDPKGKYSAQATTPASDSTVAAAPTWNQQQSESARTRISRAIADLIEQNTLPATATARFQALTRFSIGGSTLYRHRDLWHPSYLWNPPPPPASLEDSQLDCAEGASNWHSLPSLLLDAGGNTLPNKDSSDFVPEDFAPTGRNAASSEEFSDFQAQSTRLASIQYVQQALVDLHAPLAAPQDAIAPIPLPTTHQLNHAARMKAFLASGDPILMAEAQAWAASHTAPLAIAMLENGGLPGVERLTSPSSPLLESAPQASLDLSGVLAAITIQLRRLAWHPDRVGAELVNLFGKSRRAMLDDWELVEWLTWLEQQGSNLDSS